MTHQIWNQTEIESQEADSGRIRFDSHDDALDYIDKLVEDGSDFLAVKKLNFVERYKECRLIINVKITTGRDSGHYQLLFVAFPPGWRVEPDAHRESADLNEIVREHDGPKDAVLINATKFVQCPKEIVPSLVWLRPAHDVRNLLRETFAPSFRKGTFQFREVSGNREVGIILRDISQSKDGTDGLIQGITQVDGGVTGVAPQRPWHRFTKLDLQHLVSAVDVWLSDKGAGVISAKKRVDFPLEFGNVILSPCDAEL